MPRKSPSGTYFHEPVLAEKTRIAHADESDEEADWVLWGTGVWNTPKALVPTMSDGEPHPTCGVLCRIGRFPTDNPESPNNGALAKRLAECLNALAGVKDPGFVIDEVREFLQAAGESGDFDRMEALKLSAMLN